MSQGAGGLLSLPTLSSPPLPLLFLHLLVFSARSRLPAAFPNSSLKPNRQPENPRALGCMFPVMLLCLYFHCVISHLEGTTERAIFPSPLYGVEHIPSRTRWSCQGLKSSRISPSTCVYSEGWRAEHFFSQPQNSVLSRFSGGKTDRQKGTGSVRNGEGLRAWIPSALAPNPDTSLPDRRRVWLSKNVGDRTLVFL